MCIRDSNGSSCGVLAAVAACTRWGDEVLVARNSHKSLYNALYQNNLQAHYLCPEQIPGFQAAGGITAQMVKHALQKHPNVKLIAITSPTYEGVVSDVKAIAYAAHARGIPLLVDEAHGAHLGLADGFPGGAVQAGADLVVQSVHKTLPSLTQTAVLHLNGSLVSPVSVSYTHLVLSIGAGYIFYRLFNKFQARYQKDMRRFVIIAFVFCLILAYCAESLFGVADITGAYIAGVLISNTQRTKYIAARFDTLSYILLSPIFFASIGLKVSLPSMTGTIILFAVLLMIVAVLTKVIGCGLGAKLCKMTNMRCV